VERNKNRSLKSISEAIFEEGLRWGNATGDRGVLLIRFSESTFGIGNEL
jgi:hypothetical protein